MKRMKDTNYDNLGTYTKKLRQNMNLTQADVASALGVTPGYICNVENNRTSMSLRMLIYYAKITGTTLDMLVGQINPEYMPTALDNELKRQISKLDNTQKQKLLQTLKIWQE